MRNALLILAGAALLCVVGFAGMRLAGMAAPDAPAAATLRSASGRVTPADRDVEGALATIDKHPDDARGYKLLCSAYMRKARETGDFGFNTKAETSLDRAAQLAPTDADVVKLRAALLLSFHKFGEALEVAKRARDMAPEDHDVYGALTDAYVELGDYDAAVASAQTMIDMRPDTSSYSRVSYLRSLHGDTEGAIEAMRDAATSASPADPEQIAWCYTHLGDEYANAGKWQEATRAYETALYAYPDYHLALASKARAVVASGDLPGAAELYERAVQRVPLPDTAAALGDVYTKLGRTSDAERCYALVEAIDKASGANAQTYSRQIALFWADHDRNLDEALSVIRREREVRSDVFTCDALAWVLYKKGDYAGAKAAMNDALRIGTRDPRLRFHAGMIEAALGDKAAAASYLGEALALNPTFDVLGADVARATLATVKS